MKLHQNQLKTQEAYCDWFNSVQELGLASLSANKFFIISSVHRSKPEIKYLLPFDCMENLLLA